MILSAREKCTDSIESMFFELLRKNFFYHISLRPANILSGHTSRASLNGDVFCRITSFALQK